MVRLWKARYEYWSFSRSTEVGKSLCISPGAASSEIVCWVICWDVIINNATFPEDHGLHTAPIPGPEIAHSPTSLVSPSIWQQHPPFPRTARMSWAPPQTSLSPGCSKCLEFLSMLKEHASVMIKPLGVNLVKITQRRNCAKQLDFQN